MSNYTADDFATAKFAVKDDCFAARVDSDDLEPWRVNYVQGGGRLWASDRVMSADSWEPVTPGNLDAHLAAAWEAGHVPSSGTIPAGARFISRHRSTGALEIRTYGSSLPATGVTTDRRLINAPRPKGAADIQAEIEAAIDAAEADAKASEVIADALARAGYRKPAPDMPF